LDRAACDLNGPSNDEIGASEINDALR